MKIAEFFKKTAAAVFAPDTAPSTPDTRSEAAAAHAAWHQQWAEAQRAFRETHGPAVRVPGPRQLGLSWPPPHNPNAGIKFTYPELNE